MRDIKRLAPQHEAIAEVAKAARDDPDGLIVEFPFDMYSNKEAAKRAARSFQISFSAMRSRERAQAIRASKALNGYVNEAVFKGPYDHLGAYLREEEDRWEVRLLKTNADPIVIRYASTREPVKQFTPEGIRWKELSSKLVSALAYAEKSKTKVVNPLTEEEATFMWNYNGEAYREIWEDYGEEPYAPQQEPKEGIRAHEDGTVPQD